MIAVNIFRVQDNEIGSMIANQNNENSNERHQMIAQVTKMNTIHAELEGKREKDRGKEQSGIPRPQDNI